MSAASTVFAGSIPENYDRYLGPLLFEPYAMDLIHRIKNRNIASVLELACGTGRVTSLLRQSLSEKTQITATDLNPEMLQVAQKKVSAKNVTWATVDMQNIPFPDAHFDLVVCQFGIMFVPDKPKAFSEIHRVLKKGGLFLFNAWDTLENNPASFMADKVMNSYFRNDPVPFYQVPFSFHDKDIIVRTMADAGFSNPKIELIQKEGVSENATNAAIGLIEGTPAYGFICD